MPPPNAPVGGPHHQPGPTAAANAPNPLEVAAQAVAGLTRSSEHLAAAAAAAGGRDPYGAGAGGARDDDARTAEEITRQLQQAEEGGVPDGLAGGQM